MDCEMTGTRAHTQPRDSRGGIVSPNALETKPRTVPRGMIIPAKNLSESSVSPNHSSELCLAAAVIG